MLRVPLSQVVTGTVVFRAPVGNLSNNAALACRCNGAMNKPTTSAVRCLSSWVTPRHRHKRLAVGSPYYQPTASTVQQRPLVNGKSVAFHVRELPSTDSNPSQGTLKYWSEWNNLYVPPKRTYESDMVVLLDLDECLIHTRFTGNSNAESMYAHQLRQRQNGTTATATPSVALDSFRFQIDGTGPFAHVYIRPGMVEFLRHVTERFETHIFTAALPVYADYVIDKLCAKVRESPSNETEHADLPMFSGRWYRQHCVYDAKKKAYVKDLSKLSLFQANPHLLSRAVLVDNNPSSFLKNPENGILVDSFYDSSGDTALHTVRAFLDRLDHVSDVRPVLREQWRQLAQLEAAAMQTRTGTTDTRRYPEVSSQVLHQTLTRQMAL